MRIDGIVHANRKFRLIYWCNFAFSKAIVFHEFTFPIHANKSIFYGKSFVKKRTYRISLWITEPEKEKKNRMNAVVYYRLFCPFSYSIQFVQMVSVSYFNSIYIQKPMHSVVILSAQCLTSDHIRAHFM